MTKREATEKVVIPKTVGEIILKKIDKILVEKGYEKIVSGVSEVQYVKPVIKGEKLQTSVCFTFVSRIASVQVVVRDYEILNGHASNRAVCSRDFYSFVQFKEWYDSPCSRVC